MEMVDPEDYETDNVKKEFNQKDGEVKAEFSGRELLLSSIEEKCYHNVIMEIIETNKKDRADLEKRFVE